MKQRQKRETQVKLFPPICNTSTRCARKMNCMEYQPIYKRKWDLLDRSNANSETAWRTDAKFKAQHTRTRSRGLRHADLCFVTVIGRVTPAKRDQVSRCGIANVRVLKYIVHYIKTPRRTPCDIFYDGHNLAAWLAERHHCRTERACFYSIERDRGQT